MFRYETGNGIKAEEVGTLKKASSPDSNDAIIAQGSFSYTAPDGQLITITYVADDAGGFQPQVCFAFERDFLTSNVVSSLREWKSWFAVCVRYQN